MTGSCSKRQCPALGRAPIFKEVVEMATQTEEYAAMSRSLLLEAA